MVPSPQTPLKPSRQRPLRRADDPHPTRARRGVALLPSLFTMGNMFCGYACIVYSLRGDFETAAPFIGFAPSTDRAGRRDMPGVSSRCAGRARSPILGRAIDANARHFPDGLQPGEFRISDRCRSMGPGLLGLIRDQFLRCCQRHGVCAFPLVGPQNRSQEVVWCSQSLTSCPA